MRRRRLEVKSSVSDSLKAAVMWTTSLAIVVTVGGVALVKIALAIMVPQKVDDLQTWATKTEVRVNSIDTKFDRIMYQMESLLEVKKSISENDRSVIALKERMSNAESRLDTIEGLRLKANFDK